MSKIDKIKKAARKFRNWLFYESDMKSILLLLTKIYIFFVQYFFLFIEIIMSLFMKTNIKESRFFNKQEIVTKQKILWCSVCNDRYIPGLKVLLYSIKQHNPNFDYPFKIYFHDDISEENQKQIKDLYPHIIFESNSTFSHLKTWFMCLLPFKETEYDKVIFIDADILCLGDVLSHLINYDCQHFSACLDVNMKIFWNTQFNMPSFHEFNTGLFVIPKRLLTDGMKPTTIFNDLLILANKYPDAKLGDQTILNRYFAHKTITKLPGKYNAKKEIFSRQKYRHEQHDVRFLHFTGADKPFLIDNQERQYVKTKNNIYYDILYELYFDYSRSLQFSFNYLDYTNKTNRDIDIDIDIEIEVICQQAKISFSVAEHFYIKYQHDIINAIIVIHDLQKKGTYQEYLSENNLS
jgi:lipopolysaccharide biosynthesis glycosyltransferase